MLTPPILLLTAIITAINIIKYLIRQYKYKAILKTAYPFKLFAAKVLKKSLKIYYCKKHIGITNIYIYRVTRFLNI